MKKKHGGQSDRFVLLNFMIFFYLHQDIIVLFHILPQMKAGVEIVKLGHRDSEVLLIVLPV